MSKLKELEYLIDAFRSLPGVGTKNAKRFASFVINSDDIYASTFAKRILEAKNVIKKCNICNNLTNKDICEICSNNERAKSLCVVATYEDFERINDANTYDGYYFILGTELGINSKRKNEEIDIQKLFVAINSLKINEVIIATSFSLAGEATSEYIRVKLKPLTNISIYRIGFGIPLNANIDYIDNETMKESFANKKKLV